MTADEIRELTKQAVKSQVAPNENGDYLLPVLNEGWLKAWQEDAQKYQEEYASEPKPSSAPKIYCANCGVLVINSNCDCPYDCYEPVYLPPEAPKCACGCGCDNPSEMNGQKCADCWVAYCPSEY